MSAENEPAPAAEASQDQETEEAARRLILRCGYGSAAVAVIPIPFSATVGVMPIHVGMVVGLGSLYGEEISADSAGRLIARIVPAAGVSYIGSRLAMGLGKFFVPGLPGLIGAPLIFANTLAIGAVAKATFEGREELEDDDVRALYHEALEEARELFDPRQVRSPEATRAAHDAVDSADDEGSEPTLEA
jgi:uncharacterized protein (DUF697 family)